MEIRKYNSNDFEKVVEILIDSFPESSSKIKDFLICFEKLELDGLSTQDIIKKALAFLGR